MKEGTVPVPSYSYYDYRITFYRNRCYRMVGDHKEAEAAALLAVAPESGILVFPMISTGHRKRLL